MTANGATPGGVPPAHDGTGAAAHRTPLIAFDPRLGPAAAAADPLSADAQQRIRERAAQVLARYPRPRSALMPLLYLVQAEQGYVSADGIRLVADILGLTTAEVTAVATFYTMYRRRPCGRYLVGVCTNTLCAILGVMRFSTPSGSISASRTGRRPRTAR